jgi:hypothetical protein
MNLKVRPEFITLYGNKVIMVRVKEGVQNPTRISEFEMRDITDSVRKVKKIAG